MNMVAADKKFNATRATVGNWVKRYISEGESGSKDRSARRHKGSRAKPPEEVEEIIRVRMNGKITGDHVAGKTNVYHRTISRYLVRANLSPQKDIEDCDEEHTIRNEHESLSDMVHLDIQKLSNFNQEGIRNAGTGNRQKSANKAVGSQYMHIAIDDCSRYVSESILANETAECVTQHVIDTYQENASHGILIKRVRTDNGSVYKSKMVVEASKTLRDKHVFPKPFTSQTNGRQNGLSGNCY